MTHVAPPPPAPARPATSATSGTSDRQDGTFAGLLARHADTGTRRPETAPTSGTASAHEGESVESASTPAPRDPETGGSAADVQDADAGPAEAAPVIAHLAPVPTPTTAAPTEGVGGTTPTAPTTAERVTPTSTPSGASAPTAAPTDAAAVTAATEVQADVATPAATATPSTTAAGTTRPATDAETPVLTTSHAADTPPTRPAAGHTGAADATTEPAGAPSVLARDTAPSRVIPTTDATAAVAGRGEAANDVPPPASADSVDALTASADLGVTTPRRVDAPRGPVASAVVDRVMRAVELLEHAPPPRRIAIEVEGLQLTVAMQGDEVSVAVRGGADQLAPSWQRDLAGALRGRGLGLADGTAADGAMADGTGAHGGRDRRAPAQQMHHTSVPGRPSPPGDRPATRADGLQL